MQVHRDNFPNSIAEALGNRLKCARLNKNLTQNEVAQLAWISRRRVLNAEKGDVRLVEYRCRFLLHQEVLYCKSSIKIFGNTSSYSSIKN